MIDPIDIILWCESGGQRFTLEKRNVWLPEPGQMIPYVFKIPSETTVMGFTVRDVESEETMDGGMAQHFASAGGTYTVEITGGYIFPSKRKGAEQHAKQRASARNFRKRLSAQGALPTRAV